MCMLLQCLNSQLGRLSPKNKAALRIVLALRQSIGLNTLFPYEQFSMKLGG